MMKLAALMITLTVFGLGFLLYFVPGAEINLRSNLIEALEENATSTIDVRAALAEKGAPASTSENSIAATPPSLYKDIEPQKPLPDPPQIIKAVYSTSWSASSPKKIDYFIKLIKETELNAIVVDIKDFSGAVLYDTRNPDVIRYGAKEVRIPNINSVIKRFHDEGIYVIARQTVFQDGKLAGARPDLAVQRNVIVAPAVLETNGSTTVIITPTSTKREPWLDNKGLAWIDPGSHEAWDYNITIAQDAALRGFDEINFDYIRFPSDGAINAMIFNHYDAKSVLKQTQIKRFFEYLRENTRGIKISADLFGLVTVNNDDLGIGQNLELAAPYFDAIAPMVYPSHYAKGFIGFDNPGSHPYEVVRYSMERAVQKLSVKEELCSPVQVLAEQNLKGQEATSSVIAASTTRICETKISYVNAKLRPWLQDFDLGADYNAAEVRTQISAVDELVKNTPLYDGWMIWAPSNIYTKGALDIE